MDGQRAKLAARRFDRVGTIPQADPSPGLSSPPGAGTIDSPRSASLADADTLAARGAR